MSVCRLQPNRGRFTSSGRTEKRDGAGSNVLILWEADESHQLVCSALFVFLFPHTASEVVRAADTYHQEVDTLNVTSIPPPDALFTFRLQFACQPALGLMINYNLHNYFKRQQCSRRHIHHENVESCTLQVE